MYEISYPVIKLNYMIYYIVDNLSYKLYIIDFYS